MARQDWLIVGLVLGGCLLAWVFARLGSAQRNAARAEVKQLDTAFILVLVSLVTGLGLMARFEVPSIIAYPILFSVVGWSLYVSTGRRAASAEVVLFLFVSFLLGARHYVFAFVEKKGVLLDSFVGVVFYGIIAVGCGTLAVFLIKRLAAPKR